MKKQRIDDWLVEREYFDSRDEAARYIMAGKVLNGHERIQFGAEKIQPDTAQIRIKGLDKKYVSRGGFKLEKALEAFKIDVAGKVVIDIGSSTGGFTDCALQHGALHSYAVDVGTNQLSYQLRIDPRVTVMEQTNFRFVKTEDFEQQPDFATIDVSFISLELIFPTLVTLLKPESSVVALIKPQFEADREDIGEKGIISDPSVHRYVLERVIQSAEKHGLILKDLTISPIKGAAGNIEYLGLFVNDQSVPKSSDERSLLIAHTIAQKTV